MKVHVLHVPGADPERDAIVRKLTEEAEVCLHLDPKRQGLLPNWLKALECASQDQLRWSVILSDDADPLPGWKDHLDQALWYSPQPFLGLTHFGSYGRKALAKGVPYGEGAYLVWGGAIAYRQDQLLPLHSWASRIHEDTGYPHDDCLVAAFAKRTGHQTALTSRAIFDQPVARSLLGHNTPIRRPGTTLNDLGPSWGALPRSTRITRSISPRDELERLAKL